MKKHHETFDKTVTWIDAKQTYPVLSINQVQRGRVLPLPVSYVKRNSNVKKVIVTMSLIAIAFSIHAQDQSRDLNQQKAADNLFNEIMQVLPSDAKTKVLTAGTQKNSDIKVHKSKDERLFKDSTSISQKSIGKHLSTSSLPEELRNQVEKAIVEMEKGKLERAAEFRELKRTQIQSNK